MSPEVYDRECKPSKLPGPVTTCPWIGWSREFIPITGKVRVRGALARSPGGLRSGGRDPGGSARGAGGLDALPRFTAH